MSDAQSPEPVVTPEGSFMTPLPLTREHIHSVPQRAGCYFIYLEDQPFYAGMSAFNIRARLLAHATGRGSKQVRRELARQRPMYFEYLDVSVSDAYSSEVIAATEFVFMMLHSGRLLPGNMRADNYRRFGVERDARLLLSDYVEDVRKALSGATTEAFIVDSYMNPELLARYMSHVKSNVSIRLLVGGGEPVLISPADVTAQVGHVIEVRCTPSTLYARFLFVDGMRGFTSVASLMVDGRREPTRLTEVTDARTMQNHEALWSGAVRVHAQTAR
jgi:predicted GIY-YIG superfamily endonuclease